MMMLRSKCIGMLRFTSPRLRLSNAHKSHAEIPSFLAVIPGCAFGRRQPAEGAGPESITPIRGYGFRARARARPGKTAEEMCESDSRLRGEVGAKRRVRGTHHESNAWR